MRPLIFEFLEKPDADAPDLSAIHYDDQLNLNVHTATGLPAIDQLQLGTETFTRAGEGSDTEPTRANASLLSTETFTKVQSEGADQDAPVSLLMATETFTTAHNESSDRDIDVPPELPRYATAGRDYRVR